ncbi:helix-turn-helix transcriptional regulator [Clostridium beijerinckii]|uniref:Transcriptional regulator, XRE family n=1 Tax=Clostridium beijerinckii (strain ATCC 51743 / NCIMB 8052) TaxID=290402 RepID=A6LTW0_CLOB8|nr:helix-turn-helix transcriptional regulator [Clostridium beijerinckii]ABR33790.1 transcriptional regulator, XRE family [Clostridium beijerinckii NCIMB 8052]AIU02529.1 XRE family transcriptional regulator [Clostridium beijerinckii ATCC 35702]NRT24927.1 DNA-binding XRE family transcriptional regulator [Clostridium beijerinckii]NRT67480.1 DNA-binding XRE family transcriptional regulator [Clostridium beijerinckii]NRT81021.1 DNA-binding XRE family transcriptional regulator [Clostridium beijerinck
MITIKANLLKGKRALNGLTQKNIAEMIGVSEKTYNHKEAGKIKFKVDEIILLSSVFNLNISEINKIFFNNKLPNV